MIKTIRTITHQIALFYGYSPEKLLGIERLKMNFSVTAFHLSSRNGATLPQIEMNGVIFAGLFRFARQIKRSLMLPVRPTGPSFEMTHSNISYFSRRQKKNCDHLSYKNHTARKTGGSTSVQFWKLSPRGEVYEAINAQCSAIWNMRKRGRIYGYRLI